MNDLVQSKHPLRPLVHCITGKHIISRRGSKNEPILVVLTILFGSSAAFAAALTPAQAAPLLVFCLLYTPCIAAVASVKRELGGKWAAIMVLNQCVTAWLCALVMRLILLAI